MQHHQEFKRPQGSKQFRLTLLPPEVTAGYRWLRGTFRRNCLRLPSVFRDLLFSWRRPVTGSFEREIYDETDRTIPD